MFKHSADLDVELLTAVAAFPQTVANALRRVGRDFVRRADDDTVRALCTVQPEDTGIMSENTMKEVFLRLAKRNLIERIPERKGASSAWRKYSS